MIFTYDTHTVVVTSVSPTGGPTAGGTVVHVLGRGFLAPNDPSATPPTVTLGGVSAAVDPSTATDISLDVTAPAHAAATVDLVVTASDGVSGTDAQAYTYSDAPPPPLELVYRSPSGGANTVARLANTRITQALGQPDKLTFTTPVEPAGLEGISWSAFGQSLFTGLLTKSAARTDGDATKTPAWDVEASGNAFLLSKRFASGTWDGVSATAVLVELMAQSGAGFTTAIEGGLPAVTLTADGTRDLWAVLVNVCELAGAHCFVAGSTLHVFSLDSGFDPPAAVTEGNADLMFPEQGQAVSLERDYTQLANSVTVLGAAGVSARADDSTSIGQYGTFPLVVADNNLETVSACTARALVLLKQHAQPVPTIKYTTRDLKTAAGKTVHVTTSRPAITGAWLISNVDIDQLENLATGAKPRFAVTAVPPWAPAMLRSDPITRVLAAAVDAAAAQTKQPKLDGAVSSPPGGSTTINPIPASGLAGCIPSDKMTATGAVAGNYGGGFTRATDPTPALGTFTPNHRLIGLTVDAAGRVTQIAEDPIPAIKADGAEPFTANQSLGGHAIINAADPTNPQDVATKAYVDAHSGGGPSGAILANGTVPFTADQSMGTHKLTNVVDPTASSDVATKNYVDTHTPTLTGVILANGTVPFTADQPLGSHKLTGVLDPSNPQDAATKNYVDTHTPSLTGVILANGTVAFTAAQSMGGFKLTNLATPTVTTDATTKAYVDAADALAIRKDGSVAFTANQPMGGFSLTGAANPVNPQDVATKAYVDAHAGGGGVSGSGTVNKLAKWSAATTLADSAVYESGGLVGIGTTSPAVALDVRAASGNPSPADFHANYATGGYMRFLDDAASGAVRGYFGFGPQMFVGAGVVSDYGLRSQGNAVIIANGDANAMAKLWTSGGLAIAPNVANVDPGPNNLAVYGCVKITGTGGNPGGSLDVRASAGNPLPADFHPNFSNGGYMRFVDDYAGGVVRGYFGFGPQMFAGAGVISDYGLRSEGNLVLISSASTSNIAKLWTSGGLSLGPAIGDPGATNLWVQGTIRANGGIIGGASPTTAYVRQPGLTSTTSFVLGTAPAAASYLICIIVTVTGTTTTLWAGLNWTDDYGHAQAASTNPMSVSNTQFIFTYPIRCASGTNITVMTGGGSSTGYTIEASAIRLQ